MLLATVTSTSPLQVRTDGAATSATAKVVGTYSPVLAARVIVFPVAGRLYILGAA